MRDADQSSDIIINMSVRFPKEIYGFKEYKDKRHALIIVAAGNNAANLTNHNAYPAREGGSDNEMVITVAAVERSGADRALLQSRARLRRYRSARVRRADLGLRQEVKAADVDARQRHVVRRAHGLAPSPRGSKRSTLNSPPMISSTTSSLAPTSRGPVRLRAPRPHPQRLQSARSIHADVVETDKGGVRRLLTGRLFNPSTSDKWKIGGSFYDTKNLLKVARYKDGEQQVHNLHHEGRLRRHERRAVLGGPVQPDERGVRETR